MDGSQLSTKDVLVWMLPQRYGTKLHRLNLDNCSRTTYVAPGTVCQPVIIGRKVYDEWLSSDQVYKHTVCYTIYCGQKENNPTPPLISNPLRDCSQFSAFIIMSTTQCN